MMDEWLNLKKTNYYFKDIYLHFLNDFLSKQFYTKIKIMYCLICKFIRVPYKICI